MRHPDAARISGISLLLLSALFATSACGADGTAHHDDELTADAEWQGTHRISGQFVVDGAELTVACGSRLQMAPGASLVVDRGGTLALEGEGDCPVTVTSDTPGPRAGDWKRILVRDGTLRARHAWLAYGGGDGPSVRATEEASVALHDVEFRSTTGPALRIDRGGELQRATELEFRAVRGPATSTTAAALGAVESPRVDSATGPFHVHSATLESPTEWRVGNHRIRVDDALDIRAPLTIGAGTTVELAENAPIRIRDGGRFRALGDKPSEKLDVDHRVRFESGHASPGVRLHFAGSARDGNLLRWTHLDNPPSGRAIVVARSVDVQFDHVSFAHPGDCPVGGAGWLSGSAGGHADCDDGRGKPADKGPDRGD